MLRLKNPIVRNAMAANAGIIDYSQFEPRDRYEVLDDLETIGRNSPSDVADLKKIKPYAKRFGVMSEFQATCKRLGVKV